MTSNAGKTPKGTPEGALIRAQREAIVPELTITAAAAALGMTRAHWGRIESGSRSPAYTVAAMAAYLRISAGAMEHAGRPDVAVILRGAPSGRPEMPAVPPELGERVDRLVRAFTAVMPPHHRPVIARRWEARNTEGLRPVAERMDGVSEWLEDWVRTADGTAARDERTAPYA